MARRKGKSKVFYDPDRAYDKTDKGEYGKEPRMRQPKGGNVKFEGRVKQNGWNVDSNPMSTAIDYVAYHPGIHKLEIQFSKGHPLNSKKTYVYHEVPIEDALSALDSTYPRKQQLPDRERSLGASVRKEIVQSDFNFSKKYSKDTPHKIDKPSTTKKK